MIKKTDPYNDKNSIDSKWSDLTEEKRKILLWLTSLRAWIKQTDEKFFQISNWMIIWWFLYCTWWKEKLREFFLK